MLWALKRIARRLVIAAALALALPAAASAYEVAPGWTVENYASGFPSFGGDNDQELARRAEVVHGEAASALGRAQGLRQHRDRQVAQPRQRDGQQQRAAPDARDPALRRLLDR